MSIVTAEKINDLAGGGIENEKKKPRKKVAHTYGTSDILRWKFQENNLPSPWDKHIGTLPKRFIMYVDGSGGHGKTEYIIQMAKMLAMNYGKVRLNNVEQGKHVQIQASVARNKYEEIPAGKFAYCCINNFDTLVEQLNRPNSGRVVIVDSISFFPLVYKQIYKLIEMFPNKSFIFVAYKVHFDRNEDIRHLCDVKVRVENFKATMSGANRMGGIEDYVIWDKKVTGQQLKIGE